MGMLVLHAMSWWALTGFVVLAFGFLAYRLLAERGRRKTLEVTYRDAPGGTIVALGGGPSGAPMIVWVGHGTTGPAGHVQGAAPDLGLGERA
jgi:hypothetical protein